jgi:hypothetical protein
MDINNSSRFNNDSSMRGRGVDDFGYDLKTEKQEIAEITREVKQELLTKWKKTYANAVIFPATVSAMHPDVVNFLLGFNLVSVYDSIAKQAGLDAKGRNSLPQVVWQIAQEKKWDGLDQVLESKIPLVHSMHVTVASLLEQNIINKIHALSEKPFVKKENMLVETRQKLQLPLAKAIVQYPKLGEQGVTVNPLKLKYFQTPMRPSIKNWITDFHDNMGAGRHGAVDRGNYLFHSENGKKLTPVERQKLSSILKSLDESLPITIDPENQVVIFENNQLVISNQQSAISNQYPTSDKKHDTDSSYRLIADDVQHPAYNNNQQNKPQISADNEQKDIFQRYTVNSQEQKEKPSFFRRSFLKPIDQTVQQTKLDHRGSFSITQTEKVPEKNYFQRPNPPVGGQKPIAKPALENSNYFSNFGDSVANQPSHANAPIHALTPNPIVAAPKNTDAISGKTEDISTLSGNISFSSPQKFSNEKKIKPESPWHIKPAENFNNGDDFEDKLNQAFKNPGNVVNLKN